LTHDARMRAFKVQLRYLHGVSFRDGISVM
jgi:hypothetical protein